MSNIPVTAKLVESSAPYITAESVQIVSEAISTASNDIASAPSLSPSEEASIAARIREDSQKKSEFTPSSSHTGHSDINADEIIYNDRQKMRQGQKDGRALVEEEERGVRNASSKDVDILNWEKRAVDASRGVTSRDLESHAAPVPTKSPDETSRYIPVEASGTIGYAGTSREYVPEEYVPCTDGYEPAEYKSIYE